MRGFGVLGFWGFVVVDQKLAQSMAQRGSRAGVQSNIFINIEEPW